jgi:hypothetical protein
MTRTPEQSGWHLARRGRAVKRDVQVRGGGRAARRDFWAIFMDSPGAIAEIAHEIA